MKKAIKAFKKVTKKVLSTQNFNKAFKKHSKRCQKFEPFKDAQQEKAKKVVTNEVVVKDKKKGFNVTNVMVSGIFRQSVETLEK